jgi:uncharacterized protein (DUF2147 family)
LTGSRPQSAIASKEFSAGQKVKMKRPNNQPGYADGTIIRKNADGTYVVQYDGDQIDREVKAMRITIARESATIDESKSNDPSSDIFFVGEKVEAPFKGSSKSFPGKVIVDNKDGTYAIKFEDGDEDPRVPESKIRRIGDPNSAMKGSVSASSTSGASAHTYRMGEKIEARYNGGMTWLSGQILSIDRDGKYDIRYENGREERKVEPRYVRPRSDISASNRSDSIHSDTESSSFSLNDKVEARHRGGPKWYAGRITLVDNDGTYSIRYADGENETRVPARFIRFIPGTDLSSRPAGAGRRYDI